MPSLGRDLKTIREHRGYTIEDIQKATKLPINTLESIEDGSIFHDSTEINTYIRSFVRTYGRALKLDNDLILRALDQEELGNYTNLLLQQFPELLEEEPESPAEESSTNDETDKKSRKKRKSPSFTFAGDDADNKPEPSKAGSSSGKTSSTDTPSSPGLRSIDWAGVGKGYKKQRSQPPVWIISAGLIVILLVASAVLISQFDLLGSEEEMPAEPPATPLEEPNTGQDLSLDLSEDQPEEPEPEAVLADTLYLTVYAANGQLDPVRVWSDLKPRIDPYWLDQGVAYNFEFADTIRVSGSYSDMMLFLNGNRIESVREQFYNPNENALELTRSVFDSDPSWATPVPFELPQDVSEPDTVISRPSF